MSESDTAVNARQCADAVDEVGDEATADLVVVALAGSPARWLDQWHETAPGRATSATFVVDDAAAWTAGDPRDRIETAAPADTEVGVETVDSAGNLTDLGVTLTEVLESDPDERPTVLCFQSVTVLLQYAEPDAVHRFLHTLTGHAAALGVDGHFHLHADAHDDRTVASLRPLFDDIVHAGDE